MTSESHPGHAAPAARPYLRLPVDLVVAFHTKPTEIGLYAAIARLTMIHKHAVAVSRADLARWCNAERDALAGQIKRGIDRLDASAWLVVDRTAEKLRLLPTWGSNRSGTPRPLNVTRRDGGYPKGLRSITIPLDLLDLCLGKLTPDPKDAATIERYVDCALLTFADIGIYTLHQLPPGALRQLVRRPLTPRLTQLGVASAVNATTPPAFPAMPDVLARAAAGTLTTCDEKGSTIPVALTPAGTAYLRRVQARAARNSVDLAGSAPDPANMCAGSLDGSEDSIAHYAAERDETAVLPHQDAAWDVHGNHESINMESPPKDSHGVHGTQTGTDFMPANDSAQTSPTPTQADPPPEKLPLPQPDSAAVCEINHISALDPFLAAWHRALNPERGVPDAELFALLDLQQQHGAAALRRWMFGAASAGKTRVSPRYYDTCAAADACAALRGTRLGSAPTGVDMPPRSAAAAPAPRPVPPAAPPPRRLRPDQTALVAEIAARSGRTLRRPEKLADVPLDLLAQWRDIAGHPGLLARWNDPLGWLVAEATQGHAPPPLDELNRWAERGGVHWADPRLAPFRADSQAAMSADPSPQPRDPHADVGAVVACADADRTSDTSAPCTDAERWDALRQTLGAMDRATRRLLHGTRLLALRDDVAVIGVPDAPTKAAIEQRYTGPIRDLLREYGGRSVQLRLVIAPAGGPPPPAWIDPATWPQLAPGLRAALAGSAREPDGSLAVSAAAYAALCTQWPTELRALLAHTQYRPEARDAS